MEEEMTRERDMEAVLPERGPGLLPSKWCAFGHICSDPCGKRCVMLLRRYPRTTSLDAPNKQTQSHKFFTSSICPDSSWEHFINPKRDKEHQIPQASNWQRKNSLSPGELGALHFSYSLFSNSGPWLAYSLLELPLSGYCLDRACKDILCCYNTGFSFWFCHWGWAGSGGSSDGSGR